MNHESFNQRPDPNMLLARVQQEETQQKRGKLKIFLGAAAGVGKTYAMLQAVHIIVDELAHTNIPSSRHLKRWQDVMELLDAGIHAPAATPAVGVIPAAITTAEINYVIKYHKPPRWKCDRARQKIHYILNMLFCNTKEIGYR